MKIQFRQSFVRDVKNIKDKALEERLLETIKEVEAAPELRQIPHLKKLKSPGNFYRIRIGDYRLGLAVECDSVILVRFLHRKDLYRHFP